MKHSQPLLQQEQTHYYEAGRARTSPRPFRFSRVFPRQVASRNLTTAAMLYSTVGRRFFLARVVSDCRAALGIHGTQDVHGSATDWRGTQPKAERIPGGHEPGALVCMPPLATPVRFCAVSRRKADRGAGSDREPAAARLGRDAASIEEEIAVSSVRLARSTRRVAVTHSRSWPRRGGRRSAPRPLDHLRRQGETGTHSRSPCLRPPASRSPAHARAQPAISRNLSSSRSIARPASPPTQRA